MSTLITHYIDGKWLSNWDGDTNQLTSPVTEETTGLVALAGKTEVDAAVAAAQRAFKHYSQFTVAERRDLLKRIAASFQDKAEELAHAVTTDMGMPIVKCPGFCCV